MAFLAIRVPSLPFSLPELARDYPRLAWEYPRDLHVTLRYFVADEGRLTLVTRSLTEEPLSFSPLTLTLGEPGVFDHAQRGGVLWLGLEQPPEALFVMQEELERRFRGLGFAPETRPYVPHITLARFAREAEDEARAAFAACQGLGGRASFTVSKLELMKREKAVDHVFRTHASWEGK